MKSSFLSICTIIVPVVSNVTNVDRFMLNFNPSKSRLTLMFYSYVPKVFGNEESEMRVKEKDVLDLALNIIDNYH